MAGSFDSTVIDQIVVEVLTQLRQRVGSANSVETNRQTPASPEENAVKRVELTDAVITAETLKMTGQKGGVVNASLNAIITPSARDYLREFKVQLVQGPSYTTIEQNTSSKRGTIVASHLPSIVQTLLDEVKRQYASTWNVEIESGNSEVVERTRSLICRGESSQVIVFVKQPHHVACLVNRNSQCRAAVVRQVMDVQTVRADMGANVICVDLGQPTYMELRRIFRAVSETHGQIHKPSKGVSISQ